MIAVPFLPLKNPYEIIPIRNVLEINTSYSIYDIFMMTSRNFTGED